MSLPSPQQVAIWKNMDYAEKYRLLAVAIRQARELKRAGLRLRCPDDTPEQIESKLARVCIHARP